jgi:hypothetical protein
VRDKRHGPTRLAQREFLTSNRSLTVVLFAFLSRAFAQIQFLHFQLKPLARDFEQPCRVRYVAAGLRKSTAYKIALEAAHRDLHVLLEPAVAAESGMQIDVGNMMSECYRRAANVVR